MYGSWNKVEHCVPLLVDEAPYLEALSSQDLRGEKTVDVTLVQAYDDPIIYLTSEYTRRRGLIQGYSLRAFARDLEMPVSRLCDLLNRRQGLTAKRARSIGAKLGLDSKATECFCALAELRFGRTSTMRAGASARLTSLKHKNDVKRLDLDRFEVIANWYHFALLELLKGCGPDLPATILAERLQLSTLEVKAAIQRLIKVGILSRTQGKLKILSESNIFGGDIPSSAIRRFHDQLVGRARSAIHTQTPDQRHLSSLILAFNRADFKRAQDRIRDFVSKFNEEFESSSGKDVHCLALQFFQLSEDAREAP